MLTFYGHIFSCTYTNQRVRYSNLIYSSTWAAYTTATHIQPVKQSNWKNCNIYSFMAT